MIPIACIINMQSHYSIIALALLLFLILLHNYEEL
jgi:hypothetical protein